MTPDELRERLTPVAESSSMILSVDIERLPGLAPVWDQRTRFIPAKQWVRYPRMICAAAGWYGQPAKFYAEWHKTDYLQALWRLYDAADIVVGFNTVRFDNRHLRTEWLRAGLKPPSPWKDVDLYQVAARSFGFDSKSLAHLCAQLGLPGKTGAYDPAVAEAAAAGDKQARAELRTYNVGDVEANWAVYDRLRGWIPGHPHMHVTDDPVCNQCGSTDVVKTGTYRAITRDYPRYRCRACGANIRLAHYSGRVATTRGIG